MLATPPTLCPRPKKLPIEPGMKITRSEYNQLKELGLDVQAPQKKAPAAAPTGTAAEPEADK